MKKYFWIPIAILIIIIIFIWQAIYLPVGFNSKDKIVFQVRKGEGAKEMSINLQEKGLIRFKSFFRLYVLLSGAQSKLQAGDYELSKSVTIPQMVDKFVKGDVVKNSFTIIEGWNLRDIAWNMEKQGIAKQEGLFQVTGYPPIGNDKDPNYPPSKDYSQEFNFLADKPKNASLEGYLFPDTYRISSQDGLDDIVGKIVANLGSKLKSDLKKEISRQKRTVFQVITMASMIEEEVKTLNDKKIVSGILWKRLDSGMSLQVDATLLYASGNKTRQVSREELQLDSPYNTYKYRGLPQGPISNPGMDSILAAIYPISSSYWYYLSTPEGKTIFSKTLEEHNIAKAKYLR